MKRILLCKLDNKPFFLEFAVKNESSVRELINLTRKEDELQDIAYNLENPTIRVFSEMDIFSLRIHENDGKTAPVVVERLRVSDTLGYFGKTLK